MAVDHEWRDWDLRPAPDGWRALYFSAEPAAPIELPVVGWLVQIETAVWPTSHMPVEEQPPAVERERRIVAAVVDQDYGHIEPAAEHTSFWRLAAPGEEPDPAEAVAAWRRWQP